jgi:hypothetical protein
MKLKYRTFASAVSCLVGAAFAVCSAPAAGQATRQPGEPARTDDAPVVVFDPAIAARLQELYGEHRTRREGELKDPKAWADNRPARASQDRTELGQIWGSLVDSPDARAALRIHADRMARLNRMLDVAQLGADSALSKRIEADIQRELLGHAQNMQALRAALGGR